MTDRYFRLVAVPVSLLVTLTTTGFAQESTSGQSAAYNQVMSVNPFGLILVPWYNGEYERKATERATIGLLAQDSLGVTVVASTVSIWRCVITQTEMCSECIAPGFLDSGLTVFASTLPRPARRGRVVPERGFGSRTSPASSARCMSA